MNTNKITGNVVVALAVLASMTISPLFAAFSEKAAGTRSGQFLKMPVGAKYVAMGEAGTAVADDVNAIYYNIAGLARLDKKHGEYMYSGVSVKNKVDGESNPGYHWVAFAMPISETIGSAGLALQYYSAGDINETDIRSTKVGTFAPKDIAFNLSYARKLMEMPVGLNLKIVNSKIKESATTVGFDLGVQKTDLMDNKLNLGFAIQNLGGSLKFENDSSKLPILLKLGSGFKPMENWVAALDFVFPEDNSPVIALGTDYMHKISDDLNVSGRLGYNSRTRKVDGFSSISFGIGAMFKMGMFDFAWVPMGDLGSTFKISVGVKF